MERKTPLVFEQSYHIFNRGAHKQVIFLDDIDYARFQTLLHLTNNSAAVDIRKILKKYEGRSFVELFDEEKPDHALVDILAYCLMPNHFHLVLRQKTDDGISLFMRKLCTGYSMYFNLKHSRSGTLFQGRFKSTHIDTDPYFNWIFSYLHLNPLSLVELDWQERQITNVEKAQRFLSEYRYSSYYDYYTSKRPHRAILAFNEASQYQEKEGEFASLLASFARGQALFPIQTEDGPL